MSLPAVSPCVAPATGSTRPDRPLRIPRQFSRLAGYPCALTANC
nr:MAG TPA: YxlS-like protein [Caudoviricetes sp.]